MIVGGSGRVNECIDGSVLISTFNPRIDLSWRSHHSLVMYFHQEEDSAEGEQKCCRLNGYDRGLLLIDLEHHWSFIGHRHGAGISNVKPYSIPQNPLTKTRILRHSCRFPSPSYTRVNVSVTLTMPVSNGILGLTISCFLPTRRASWKGQSPVSPATQIC